MCDGRQTSTTEIRVVILCATLCRVARPALCAQNTPSEPPYKDVSLSFDERARDLVSRMTLDLPSQQRQLLKHIEATGKPIALILIIGSPPAVNSAEDNLPAIIEAWCPGEVAGTAVAGALAGDFSPSGRLPVIVYESVDQLPAFEDYSMARRSYRYLNGEPHYPFGYGPSFTSFDYSNPRTDNKSVPATEAVTISADVTNSGKMAGDEVVQRYLSGSAPVSPSLIPECGNLSAPPLSSLSCRKQRCRIDRIAASDQPSRRWWQLRRPNVQDSDRKEVA